VAGEPSGLDGDASPIAPYSRQVPLEVFGVDAFTREPFTGNPAAVCLLNGSAPEGWMQRTARELAQPTTAFLWHEGEGPHLRWFTPTHELPLCGHATLAAAHVLRELGHLRAGEAMQFATPAGYLAVRERDGLIWLTLPSTPLVPVEPPPGALEALGVDSVAWFGCSDFEYVAVLDSPARVEAAQPDPSQLRQLPVPRTILTAAGGAATDITSRVFIPALGVDEDQVTGSAHAVLGALWAKRLGRDRLTARQASPRGGTLTLDVVSLHEVQVGGHAVTVSRGDFLA
jgi:PhzF family phenazine biosynthesis protein